MRHLGAFLLLALLATPVSASPGPDAKQAEAQKLLREAGTLFRQANDASLHDPDTARELYQRAALRFERIVRQDGITNGKLFYNIGNAYFRAGDLGRAILNYRRAALFIPDDANLLHNLEFARRSRADKFEEKQEKRVLRTLLFFHYDLSPGWRAALLVLLAGLFWIGAAVRLLRPQWAPRSLLVLTGALGLVFLTSLAVDVWSERAEEPGVIVARQVVARIGDGESYEPAYNEPLHAGAEFVVLDKRDGWDYIELPGGHRCWIPASAAGLVKQF